MALGRIDKLGLIQAVHGLCQGGLGGIKIISHRRLTQQARLVRHDLPQRDWLSEGVPGMEVREIS